MFPLYLRGKAWIPSLAFRVESKSAGVAPSGFPSKRLSGSHPDSPPIFRKRKIGRPEAFRR